MKESGTPSGKDILIEDDGRVVERFPSKGFIRDLLRMRKAGVFKADSGRRALQESVDGSGEPSTIVLFDPQVRTKEAAQNVGVAAKGVIRSIRQRGRSS